MNTDSPPATEPKPHAAFFRQSGWMVIAAVVGGAMTYGLHPLTKSSKLPETEYGIFITLLALTNCIPAMPLQMVFSQQIAKGLALGRERQVGSMIRLTWLWSSVLWVIAVIGILAFQDRIAAHWKLTHLSALWWTLPVLLASAWMPMFSGVLQGQQNFFWVGWMTMVGGFSRLVFAVVFVLFVTGGATGMMIGVFAGYALGAVIGVWETRALWLLPPEPFDKRQLLEQIVPLILGFGAFQFLFSADTLFSKGYFDSGEMAFYGAAGTMSRAILWIALPIAQVMFPKIVHSATKSEKSSLQNLVLLGTLAMSVCGAVSLPIVAPWAIRLVYSADYVKPTLALLPWYAWAMVPLAVGNVMMNNLLARSAFRVVPALILIATGYGLTLSWFHETPRMVLQVFGAFNLLLVGACAWFTWGKPEPLENRR